MTLPAAAPNRVQIPGHSDSGIYMDTVVAIEVVGTANEDVRARVRRALNWFGVVEDCCSRFDPRSELTALCRRPGEEVAVSELLFNILEISIAVAQVSNGAFDPTLGARMRELGFDRNHRSGGLAPSMKHQAGSSFRDIRLDSTRRTATLNRALSLDLGGVAKGFAIDLAAHELAPLGDYAVNAGGDVFVAGHNSEGELWQIGIRDPQNPARLTRVVAVSGVAVCTSAGYERQSRNAAGHHIVDPATGNSPPLVTSATVIAPRAALADALATAVFVLGPRRGIRLLERQGAEGLIGTTNGSWAATPRFPGGPV